jgi:hypothetical protein
MVDCRDQDAKGGKPKIPQALHFAPTSKFLAIEQKIR